MSLDPVTLKLASSAPNALSWSEDGELAIAAGENVHLMLPNRSSAGSKAEERTKAKVDLPDFIGTEGRDKGGNSQKPWTEIDLLVTAFTEEEWPVLLAPECDNDNHLFIGKEQRHPEVAALEWSAAGLARHDRCALAVLTTNGLLSVWLPGPNPIVASAWSRAVILNRLIAEHSGQRLLQQVVRAFTWNKRKSYSPTASDHQSPHQYQLQYHLLAVLTEQSIYLFQFHGSSSGSRLEARLVFHQILDRLPSDNTSLQQMIEASHHGAYVVLHEQLLAPNSGQTPDTFISVVTNGYLNTIRLKFAAKSENIAGHRLHSSTPAHGPLCLKGNRLFYFYKNILREWYLRQDESGNFVTGSSGDILALEGWDSPVAILPFGTDPYEESLVFVQPASGIKISVVPSNHDTKVSEIRTFSFAETEDKSTLEHQLREAANAYAEKHGAGDQIRIKALGAATFGGRNQFLVALVTFWPSDQIIYHVKANDRSHLLLTHRSLESNGLQTTEDTGLPWQSETSNGTTDRLIAKVMEIISTAKSDTKAAVQLLSTALCARVLMKDQSAVDALLKSLGQVSHGEWNQVVVNQLDVAQAADGELSEIVDLIIERSQTYDSDIIEQCQLPGCSRLLRFTSHQRPGDAAVCSGHGHTFSRCAITGMAIQQPFISKRCESCNRIFMDHEKTATLPALHVDVIKAFKRCPLCAGRFVG